MPDFRLPDLGEGLEEAEVISWRVRVGEYVEVDQIVADVETAKAVVEVPVPFAGRVSALHAEPGTVVAVGAPLISVAAEARHPREPDAGAAGGSGSVLIGYGTSAAPRRPWPTQPDSAPRAGQVSAPRAEPAGPGPVPVISPLVRKLARDGGLDLRRITGTGPMGMIRRHDVEEALGAARQSAEPSTPKTP